MLESTPDPANDVPVPDCGFDPWKACPTKLEYFRLPARPDPVAEPALHRLWAAMFPAGVRFVGIKSQPATCATAIKGRSARAESVGARIRRPMRRRLTSVNWSGGYAYPRYGARFVQVGGSWVVPETSAGSPDDRHAVHRQHDPLPYRCTIWIGVDGRQRWATGMPQLGTEHNADGSARFWWQWWTPNNKCFQFYVPEIAVQAKQRVICNLSIIGGEKARFHFFNADSKEFGTVEVKWPGHLHGSSAEWILERPGDPVVVDGKVYNNGLHRMPNFGHVELTEFAAKMVPAIESDPSKEIDERALQLISNRTTRTNPRRNVIVSRAKRSKATRNLVLDYRP